MEIDDPAIPPDEVELQGFMMKVNHAMKSEEWDLAETEVDLMLVKFSLSIYARLIAIAFYVKRQRWEEALVQAAIGLALHPDVAGMYKRIAYILYRRGKKEAAQAILENGWNQNIQVRQARIRLRTFTPEEKQKYFDIGHNDL